MERNRDFQTLAAVSILVMTLLRLTLAQYGGGTGDPNDPYQIWTPEQMNAIGADPNDWDKHFQLMADIDLSAYDGQDGRPAFNIIGDYTLSGRGGGSAISFRGVFDGKGHAIANLAWTPSDTPYEGLFKSVRSGNGEIKNLHLINPRINAGTKDCVGALVGSLEDGTVTNCHVEGGVITGRNGVGGLVGACDEGTITECHVTGVVIGNDYVGGLVGSAGYYINIRQPNDDDISRCYATATVAGNDYVGGLAGIGGAADSYATGVVIGNNYLGGLIGGNGRITNCYAAAIVVGTIFAEGHNAFVGGLQGYTHWDTYVVDSFWDIQISRQTTSAAGEGRTTPQMQTATTFLAWGEPNNAGVWTIDEGHDYPRLAWEGRPGIPIESLQFANLVAGTGTPDDPYLIQTAEQLNLLAMSPAEWDKHFKLMADLDLGGYANTGFPSIGSEENPFGGVFDGNGHIISKYVNASTDGGHAGLFGYVERHSKNEDRIAIKNLGLIDPIVDGGTAGSTGALVSYLARVRITDCYVKGGIILGSENTGGLVGRNWGTITGCYASVPVIGGRYAGGLVGDNDGPIRNCYSTGVVLGGDATGGLVGFVHEPERVIGSFWDIETSGRTASGGGEGKTTVEMQTASTFLEAGWDFVGETENGVEDIWWILEGQDYPKLWWEVTER